MEWSKKKSSLFWPLNILPFIAFRKMFSFSLISLFFLDHQYEWVKLYHWHTFHHHFLPLDYCLAWHPLCAYDIWAHILLIKGRWWRVISYEFLLCYEKAMNHFSSNTISVRRRISVFINTDGWVISGVRMVCTSVCIIT